MGRGRKGRFAVVPNHVPQLTTEVRRYFKAFAEGMLKDCAEDWARYEYQRAIDGNIADEFRHMNDYFYNRYEKPGL